MLWHTLFSWPYGICTGNLIASAIWATPVFAYTHIRLRKLHHAVNKRNAAEHDDKIALGAQAARPGADGD
jgi:hypothetical protein